MGVNGCGVWWAMGVNDDVWWSMWVNDGSVYHYYDGLWESMMVVFTTTMMGMGVNDGSVYHYDGLWESMMVVFTTTMMGYGSQWQW